MSTGPNNYYWDRTMREIPGYFNNLSNQPLKPLGTIPHVADGIFRTTTDLARLFQSDPRPIKPLAEQSRLMDSLSGAGSDLIGGVRDVFHGKLVSAAGKITASVLEVGDALMGAGADLSDQAFGADDRTSYNLAA